MEALHGDEGVLFATTNYQQAHQFELDFSEEADMSSVEDWLGVDLVRFEGVGRDLRLQQRTPRLPGSRDHDDPIWAHRLALKLERDLDERFELPGRSPQRV
jgi:hypothetical protein